MSVDYPRRWEACRTSTCGKLIALEGLDGSGKSVQLRLLAQRFSQNQIRVVTFSFPRVDVEPYGRMIGHFLQGQYGSVTAVDPHIVALLFALDRLQAAPQIRKWLDAGALVLLDRYVYSNIAFQCAKVKSQEARVALREWIVGLEYGYHAIPRPDLSVFLNVPFEFVCSNLSTTRPTTLDRDIHEADLELQRRVMAEYSHLAKTQPDLVEVDCSSERESLSEMDVCQLILGALRERQVVPC